MLNRRVFVRVGDDTALRLRRPSGSLAQNVKTMYLYDMGSRLLNVRLDDERVRKVQALRERGMTMSDVVRKAIDEQFAELRATSPAEVAAIVQRMFEQHPDPPDLPARDYDVHDRRAARQAIVGKLRRDRP